MTLKQIETMQNYTWQYLCERFKPSFLHIHFIEAQLTYLICFQLKPRQQTTPMRVLSAAGTSAGRNQLFVFRAAVANTTKLFAAK